MPGLRILVPTLLAVCGLACGAPAEGPAPPGASDELPAVSAGAPRAAGHAPEMTGSLAELPDAPAPGPALLESSEGVASDVPAEELLSASGEPSRPRIVLDAAPSELGPAILGTGLDREPLAPTGEPEGPLADEMTPGSAPDTPVPAALVE